MPSRAERRVLSERAATPSPSKEKVLEAESKVESPRTPSAIASRGEPPEKTNLQSGSRKSPTVVQAASASQAEPSRGQTLDAAQGNHHPERTGMTIKSLECPICFDVFRAAVTTRCGHTFCFSCIMRHFRTRKSCPVCGSFLTRDQIAPNNTMQKAVRLAQAASSKFVPRSYESHDATRSVQCTHLGDAELSKKLPCEMKDLIDSECVAESDGEFKSEAAEAFAALMAQQSGTLQRPRRKLSPASNLVSSTSDRSEHTRIAQTPQPERSNESNRLRIPNQRLLEDILSDLGKETQQNSGYSLSETLKKLANRLSSSEIDQVVDALLEQRRRLQQVRKVADYPTLKDFLRKSIEGKRLEIAKLHAQLTRLEEDSQRVEELRRRAVESKGHSITADSPDVDEHRRERMFSLFEQLQMRYLELRASTRTCIEQEPTMAGKRPRRGETDPGPSGEMGMSPLALPPVTATETTGRISEGAEDENQSLEIFACEIAAVTRYSHLRTLAALRYGEPFRGSNIVSCLDFDMFGEFLAAAGVMRKIKIFELNTAINQNAQAQYPVCELPARAKLSCLNWSPAARQHIAASDYDGVITIWDTNTCKAIAEYEEHEKRAWTVDYCPSKPHVLASGSDDGNIKLWSTAQNNSLATIRTNANVCSIKFVPNLYDCCLAIGSADHSAYVYDLRNLTQPLHVFRGHSKAVSYVRFFPNGRELVTASTDATLRLWDLQTSESLRVYSGHCNERNFVGLTVKTDWIACGSEDNSVYTYYRSLPGPTLTYQFLTEQPQHLADLVSLQDKPSSVATTSEARTRQADANASESAHFVSAVAWRKETEILAAANSQGLIKILELS
ncbi:coatomer subunit alpha [Cyanidiococcus yangmingshanensis]|uniref:Coatomer subunit alpha n=1 Tax=Cyanidiococcus yangmingshanensis TaxID=2690220 RepID=A0A7J7IHQ9_9RHOD|nr:coatomer subunit alpha [Cyanidiococcus yangmingshanensis]